MKIICPGHQELISIPHDVLMEALSNNSKGAAFSCPVCQEKVLISNLQLEIISAGRAKKVLQP